MEQSTLSSRYSQIIRSSKEGIMEQSTLSFSSSVSKESVYVTKGAWHHKKSINEFTDS